jgi:hypothetical protein
MLKGLRSRLTYANVVATLALVFAMSGGALAATHYLISSTKQISPKVLEALHGVRGKTGATGSPGPAGTAGATGNTGPKGDPGVQGLQGIQGIEGPIGNAGGPAAHWNKSTNKAETVELEKVGAFTISGICKNEGEGEFSAQTVISSSQSGSWVDYSEESPVKVTAGQQVPIGESAEGESGEGEYVAEGTYTAISADGKSAVSGLAADGAFATTGEKCSFAGYAVGS